MDREICRNYIEIRREMDDWNYLFCTIAFNIAPSILANKPASLINFCDDSRHINKLWEKYEAEITGILQIKHRVIRASNNNVLVLFYNELELNRVISHNVCREFLEDYGYSRDMDVNQCLDILEKKFIENCPHEIGVFLGIPVYDVIGFITNSGKNFLYTGYWKVYKDKDMAMKIFNSYDAARKKVLDYILNNGKKSI